MVQLRLYNTLTRSKEEFHPLDPARVRMYVCGPTVYDFAHIGNARPVIVFDVLYRLLRHLYGPDHVTYVRNITDVDDKINDRAARDFPGLPLNEAIRRVTETTASQYMADVKALGCLEPDEEPRATENIAQMIEIINKLYEKDIAYIATGPEGREVLFSIAKMPDYGQLSRRKLEDQQAGARIAVEGHKKSPGDFVLWKESGPNEPGWSADFEKNTPSGDIEKVNIHGRPGWHIECSAMSNRYLGETFDIHGGGLDLIFPHHENEIAQSRCAFGHDVMAKVWMHNGFLQVEGEKMSKSLGNFVTINELLATEKFGGRKWPGEVLRLAMLKTHYRQPIDWTVKSLEEAEKTLDRWYRCLPDGDGSSDEKPDDPFLNALSDDLNTPQAISILHELFTSDMASKHGLRKHDDPEAIQYDDDLSIAVSSARILGLLTHPKADWEARKKSGTSVSEAAIDTLVTARLAARAAKKWAESDRIRDELVAMGIEIMDSKDPATGELKTTWKVKR